MLLDVGLDDAAADADVAALHQGRILVLVRTSGPSSEAAAGALDAASTV